MYMQLFETFKGFFFFFACGGNDKNGNDKQPNSTSTWIIPNHILNFPILPRSILGMELRKFEIDFMDLTLVC